MIKVKENKERVIKWFENARKYGRDYINLWYSPNGEAWKALVKEGVLKNRYVGKIFVGTEYKGGLFTQVAGPGDCEELLFYHGQI